MPVKLKNIDSISPNATGQVDVTSDLNLSGTPAPVYRINGIPISAAGGPWTDVTGGIAYTAGNVGIGGTNPPFDFPGYLHLTVGPQSPAASGGGIITACHNTTSSAATVGSFCYANFSLAAADKRIAEIRGDTDGAANSGTMVFNTWNAGNPWERMRITATGNVGIGTGDPDRRLHVVGQSFFSANNEPWSIFIQATKGGNGYWLGAATDNSGALLFSETGGAERMRITSAGNVGIGTTDPLSNLHIRQSVDGLSGGLRLERSSGGGWYGMVVGGDNQLYIQPGGGLGIAMNGSGWVGIRTPTISSGLTVNSDVIRHVNDNYGAMWFNDGNNNFYLLLTNHYDPHGGWNGLRPFYVQMSTGNVMMSHNVDIGGTAKIGAAYVQQTGDLGVARNSNPGTGVIYFGNAGHAISWDGANFNFTSHIITTGSAGIAGRIGIGTNGAGSKLHLLGAGQDGASGLYWPGSGAEAEAYLQDSGGSGGSGGAILFGSTYGPHAAIKGFVTSGAGPMGHIVFYFRPTAGDSAFYERMRLDEQGNLNISGQFRVNGSAIGSGWINRVLLNATIPLSAVSWTNLLDLALPLAGHYAVFAVLHASAQGDGFNGTAVYAGLLVGGGDFGNGMALWQAHSAAGYMEGTASQVWMVGVGGATTLTLRAMRSAAGGGGGALPSTSLTAVWVSP